MNNFFFCPLLETFCQLFNHFAQMGSILPRQHCNTAVHFAYFQKSGQEKGCFGVGLQVFRVRTYPRKGLVMAE